MFPLLEKRAYKQKNLKIAAKASELLSAAKSNSSKSAAVKLKLEKPVNKIDKLSEMLRR